jgi:hypothetical protein
MSIETNGPPASSLGAPIHAGAPVGQEQTDEQARPEASRRPAVQPSPKTRLLVGILLIQLACLPLVARYGPPDPWTLVGLMVIPGLAVAIPVRGRSISTQVRDFLRWIQRRGAMRSARRSGEAANPLLVLDQEITVGEMKGPWGSQVGVTFTGKSWSSVLWASDGPGDLTEDPNKSDGISRILDFGSPNHRAASVHTIVQQSSPSEQDPSADVLASAWLVVKVDPVQVLTPECAINAVPALLRNEVRHLMRHADTMNVSLVALNLDDLVSALMASSEITPATESDQVELNESWRGWRACGRFHQCLMVRPPSADRIAATANLLLDAATLCPGTTVTVAVRRDADSQRPKSYPITVRISHWDEAVVAEIMSRISRALKDRGARSRGLSGRQAKGFLATTLLGHRAHD